AGTSPGATRSSAGSARPTSDRRVMGPEYSRAPVRSTPEVVPAEHAALGRSSAGGQEMPEPQDESPERHGQYRGVQDAARAVEVVEIIGHERSVHVPSAVSVASTA